MAVFKPVDRHCQTSRNTGTGQIWISPEMPRPRQSIHRQTCYRPIGRCLEQSRRTGLRRRDRAACARAGPVSSYPEIGAASRRVGFFGGAFDPVHRGHLHAARAARDAFSLDRVLLAPAALPPNKRRKFLAPARHRLEMIRLATERERGLEPSALDLAEGGPSYTINVLKKLEDEMAEGPPFELFLVLGSDTLADLPGWRGIKRILRTMQPIVVLRSGEPDTHLAALENRLAPELWSRVSAGFLRLPPVEVAATDVRRLIGCGVVPWDLVPPSVLGYIRERGLYARR